MENINNTIAKNIIKYRKQKKLTQLQLSEMLNYSDKSISKWERGAGVPEVETLLKIADIFGVTLNDLCYEKTIATPIKPNKIKKCIIISALSCGLVWLVAVVAFVLLNILLKSGEKYWLSFIYAIPINFILLLIFNKIWGKRIFSAIWTSGIVWSIILSLTLSLSFVSKIYFLYFIGIPLEALIIVWFLILKRKN